MINTVQVRNVTLGDGIPKICVPIVARDRASILEEARRITTLSADLVEWRADWFSDVFLPGETESLLSALRGVLGDMPLLFTFRTHREGGALEADQADYVRLTETAILSGCADMVDVELFTGSAQVSALIHLAHEHGVKVVVSNHDFKKTPARDDLVNRLEAMKLLGADLPKIAVMPSGPQDVLVLLSATWEASSYLHCPVITMAMGGCGLISRLSGEVFGSALTFGCAGQASAPGQIGLEELRQVLELIHGNL